MERKFKKKFNIVNLTAILFLPLFLVSVFSGLCYFFARSNKLIDPIFNYTFLKCSQSDINIEGVEKDDFLIVKQASDIIKKGESAVFYKYNFVIDETDVINLYYDNFGSEVFDAEFYKLFKDAEIGDMVSSVSGDLIKKEKLTSSISKDKIVATATPALIYQVDGVVMDKSANVYYKVSDSSLNTYLIRGDLLIGNVQKVNQTVQKVLNFVITDNGMLYTIIVPASVLVFLLLCAFVQSSITSGLAKKLLSKKIEIDNKKILKNNVLHSLSIYDKLFCYDIADQDKKQLYFEYLFFNPKEKMGKVNVNNAVESALSVYNYNNSKDFYYSFGNACGLNESKVKKSLRRAAVFKREWQKNRALTDYEIAMEKIKNKERQIAKTMLKDKKRVESKNETIEISEVFNKPKNQLSDFEKRINEKFEKINNIKKDNGNK